MKFGLAYNTAYYGADPDLMAATARHAEKCGFESFYMSEHIVMYPGAALPGYVPLPPDLAVADPLECLAYVAAATSTLLLGTAVLLLPGYTRWGQIDMTADEVRALASQGVTRLVVSPSSTELAEMQAEMSSFARRRISHQAAHLHVAHECAPLVEALPLRGLRPAGRLCRDDRP